MVSGINGTRARIGLPFRRLNSPRAYPSHSLISPAIPSLFPPDAWLEQACVSLSLASQERLNELEEEEKDAKKGEEEEEEAARRRERERERERERRRASCPRRASLAPRGRLRGGAGRLPSTRRGQRCPFRAAYPVRERAPALCHGIAPQDEEAKKAKEKEKEEEEAEKKKLPPSERIKKLRMDPLGTGFYACGLLCLHLSLQSGVDLFVRPGFSHRPFTYSCTGVQHCEPYLR